MQIMLAPFRLSCSYQYLIASAISAMAAKKAQEGVGQRFDDTFLCVNVITAVESKSRFELLWIFVSRICGEDVRTIASW